MTLQDEKDFLIFKAIAIYGNTRQAADKLGMTQRNLQMIIKKNPLLWSTAQYTYTRLNTSTKRAGQCSQDAPK